MKCGLAVLLVLLAFLPLAAAEPGFFFRVTDCATGEPIAGALAAIIRGSYGNGVSTNATVYAYFDSPYGEYTYYISMQGYRMGGGEEVKSMKKPSRYRNTADISPHRRYGLRHNSYLTGFHSRHEA